MQVVDSRTRGWSKVPTVLTEFHQRYSDVSETKLFTPTFDGFVAMKAFTWIDRHSARDLFDLEGLSDKGEVTQGARELIERLKGFRLSRKMMMGRVVGLWHEELAHQTRLEKSEEECLERLLTW